MLVVAAVTRNREGGRAYDDGANKLLRKYSTYFLLTYSYLCHVVIVLVPHTFAHLLELWMRGMQNVAK